MSEPSDLASALDGARLAGMMPYLQAELGRMEEACITRMDQTLQAGTLTPELAQQAWVELLSYRRLRRRFEQKVRMGVTMGERHAGLLSGEPALPI